MELNIYIKRKKEEKNTKEKGKKRKQTSEQTKLIFANFADAYLQITWMLLTLNVSMFQNQYVIII